MTNRDNRDVGRSGRRGPFGGGSGDVWLAGQIGPDAWRRGFDLALAALASVVSSIGLVPVVALVTVDGRLVTSSRRWFGARAVGIRIEPARSARWCSQVGRRC